MNLRKFFSLITVIAILMSTGFGCKGLSTVEKQAIAPVELEYWTVLDDVDAIRALIDEYVGPRSYLNVTVRQLREDELYSRLVEALAEDKGPDIVSVPNRLMSAYRSKLAVMPTSVDDATVQVIKKKLGTDTIVTINNQIMPSVSNIDSEYVQAVKKDVVYGNNIYGLPLSLDVMAIYYNKDLLDRAGVPEAPKNWSEFQTAVKKLNKYDSEGEIVQSGAALGLAQNILGFDDLIFALFKQSGIEFVDKNGYATFDQYKSYGSGVNPVVSVMNFYTDFANSNRDTYSWNDKMGISLDEFVRGKTAFYFGYSSDAKKIKALSPQLNVRLMPLLQLNSDLSVNVANYWVQSVLNKSNHQQEAWGLVNYLAHSSATKKYLDLTGRPTALRAYITEQSGQNNLSAFSSQVLSADSWYRGKNYPDAKGALADMIKEWLQTPPDNYAQDRWQQEIINRAAARINQTL
ncbi:MAG: extracellular solute-binding protein [bacterium]